MSRSGIVNVRMVITEEKILSNMDKVQKLINPNSKKQIVQLEEDAFFKDLMILFLCSVPNASIVIVSSTELLRITLTN